MKTQEGSGNLFRAVTGDEFPGEDLFVLAQRFAQHRVQQDPLAVVPHDFIGGRRVGPRGGDVGAS